MTQKKNYFSSHFNKFIQENIVRNHTCINNDCIQYKKYIDSTPDIFRIIESKHLNEGIKNNNNNLKFKGMKQTQYECLKFQSDIGLYYPKKNTICQSLIITGNDPFNMATEIYDFETDNRIVVNEEELKKFLSFEIININDLKRCMSNNDFLDYKKNVLNNYNSTIKNNKFNNIHDEDNDVFGYFASDINKYIQQNIDRNHICTNNDCVQYKKGWKIKPDIFRIIESKHLNETISSGQLEVLKFQSKKCLYYCKNHENTICNVFIITGNPPYDIVQINDLSTDTIVVIDKKELIKFLSFEKINVTDLNECMSTNDFLIYKQESYNKFKLKTNAVKFTDDEKKILKMKKQKLLSF